MELPASRSYRFIDSQSLVNAKRAIRYFETRAKRHGGKVVETRIAPRYRVMKAAKIKFGADAIDCTVRDLSITGAALEVSNQIGIPAEFVLVMPDDGLHLSCHVVWRREFRIGVAFD